MEDSWYQRLGVVRYQGLRVASSTIRRHRSSGSSSGCGTRAVSTSTST